MKSFCTLISRKYKASVDETVIGKVLVSQAQEPEIRYLAT